MVELGDRVKDKITGLVGIVTSRTEFLYDCVRVSVASEKLKDGKPIENAHFDEDQLEVVKKCAVGPKAEKKKAKPRPTGGPERDMNERTDI